MRWPERQAGSIIFLNKSAQSTELYREPLRKLEFSASQTLGGHLLHCVPRRVSWLRSSSLSLARLVLQPAFSGAVFICSRVHWFQVAFRVFNNFFAGL